MKQRKTNSRHTSNYKFLLFLYLQQDTLPPTSKAHWMFHHFVLRSFQKHIPSPHKFPPPPPPKYIVCGNNTVPFSFISSQTLCFYPYRRNREKLLKMMKSVSASWIVVAKRLEHIGIHATLHAGCAARCMRCSSEFGVRCTPRPGEARPGPGCLCAHV